MFLFLSDVTAAHGATRIVSRELTRDTPVMQLSFPKARVSDARHAEWEAAAVSAVGPRGSLLIYSADTVHRGTEFSLPERRPLLLQPRLPGRRRRLGRAPTRGRARVIAGWTPLVERCSPRQLEALGFPPPGHPYWDEATLQGAAERYPGLDLTPWRAALAGRLTGGARRRHTRPWR